MTYTYGVEVVVNTGNFDNIKVKEELTLAANPGEKADDLRARVQERVNSWLEQDMAEIEKDLRAKPKGS